MMEPGIYFGLPEADYHAEQALSNSGIKWLCVSPMDFWARSWMNPAAKFEESAAMEMGTAYHTRILEGQEAFYGRYAPALEAKPGDLVTAEDLRSRLRELDCKTSGNKSDLIDRVLELDPSAPVFDAKLASYMTDHEGKTFLSQDTLSSIEIAAAMIERHPDLGKCFVGGMPEVSIFWIDKATGTPMKSRLDYLKTAATIDLKTFSNPLGKPVHRAVATSMASGKYHIQAALYTEAVEHAKEFVKQGRVFGEVGPDFLKRFTQSDDHKFVFVFQQTGIAPVARGFVFPRSGAFQVGQVIIREKIDLFAQLYKTFGEDPWLDTTGLEEFRDDEFPSYMYEA